MQYIFLVIFVCWFKVEDDFLQTPVNYTLFPVLWHKPSGSESTSTTELQNGTSPSILAANEGKSEQADDKDGDVLNYLFSRHSNIVGAATDLLRRSCDVERVPEVDIAKSDCNIDAYDHVANSSASLATCTARCIHECDVCHCTFSSNDLLLRHKAIHAGVKAYVCEICSKAFARRHNLRRHQLIHTGVKAYACDICSKAFARKYLLKRHQIIHTGEKPFACIECGKAFNQMSTLVAHRFTHSDEKVFECSVCHKAFKHQSKLFIHQRIHTGDKPFKCEICSRRFTQNGHLKIHKLIHTSETLYSCDVCHKGVNHLCSLQRHMLLHFW